MTYPYTALIGPDCAARRLFATMIRRHGWRGCLVDSQHLIVFTPVEIPHIPLADSQGLILGDLFSKDEASVAATGLSSSEARAITRTGGRHLLDRYWGQYVALLRSADDGAYVVVRDPSGAVPCYYFRAGQTVVVTSTPKAVVEAGLLPATIDWTEVRRHLATSGLRTGATCLTGLAEVLPGFQLDAAGNAPLVPRPWWSPWDHVAHNRARSFNDASEQVAATVQACVKALASRHRKILVNLSGGLDSSIVAACLANQEVLVECLNLVADNPQGDERPYARELANRLGLTLHEEFFRHEDVDPTRTQADGVPRPAGLLFDQSAQERQRTTARDRGCDAVFNGGGGDNVFGYTHSVSPLLDRLDAEGLGAGAWRTIDDLCRLTGASLWKVLSFAVRRQARGRQGPRRYIDLAFLVGCLEDIDRTTHPWLIPPPGHASGKASHIAALARAQVAFDFTLGHDQPPTIRPLLSQPIMELCLSIPSWMWISGGRDRAVARAAFSSLIPRRLIQRRTKGSPDAFAIAIIEAQRPALFERLRSGALAGSGLLDLNRLEEVLQARGPLAAPDHIHLGALVAADAWARAWTSDSPHQNAASS